MGFMDRLRAELVDVVEWLDDSQHTLVWRFPRYENEIKHGARLIVRPGQSAVFVHQGKLADVFGPGEYRLETGNLPILSSLLGWHRGFESSFKSEVYFVSTRQIPGLKWGTPNPVMMKDPDFGPVRVRAFGTYVLAARDPRTLLKELVGTDGLFEAEEITELLRSIIAQAFADVVAKAQIPLLELSSHYPELAEQVRRVVVERIDDEYGLEVPQLYIVNISVPAEVEQALDARTSMGVIGNLGAFRDYQLAQSMPVAAANPSGGLAGAGIGLGMGMAAATSWGAGAPSPAGPGAAPQAPPPPPAPVWHVAEGGQSLGPFTTGQLAEAAAQGRLTRDTLVWTAGLPGWSAAGALPQLAGLFPPPAPPADPNAS